MTKIEITTAKNCGFCQGVQRAVACLEKELEEAKGRAQKIYLVGKIIHNSVFINEITAKGATIINDCDIGEIPKNSVVVTRAHGLSEPVFEQLCELGAQKNLKIVDATCPCVKKMHQLAKQNTGEDTFAIILGDLSHPEIVALDSYINGDRQIIKDCGQLAVLPDALWQAKNHEKIVVMAQTTHDVGDYEKCKRHIQENCAKAKIEAVFFDTICRATEERQAEAELLSKESDMVIVVGDHNSSNTKKLYEICKKNCENSFIIETSGQLPLHISKNLLADLKEKSEKKGKDALQVSITAGASTPDSIIMEVKKSMTENIINGENNDNIDIIEERSVGAADIAEAPSDAKEEVAEEAEKIEEVEKAEPEPDQGEKSFAELLDETFAPVRRGDRVKGTVSYISDNEVHVDVGYKYTGVLSFDEATDNSSADLKEMFKVGDEIETQIIKTNDQEGIALLSKKRIDSSDGWDKIIQFYEEGTVGEAKVVQVVNGGVIALLDTIKVFIPASHADVTKDTDLSTLIGKKVKVKIIDINTQKRRAIASIRNASMEERRASEDKIWGEIEINKRYQGVVKSIASYGAFVDIGGIDGMIHRTELSWSRIKHPSEVVGIGDKVDVYIKDFDREKRRIALGYKNESDNPWTKFVESAKEGDVVEVKILNTMPFGAFAEIVPGVDGLIHISQIADKKISKPSDVLNIGDMVTVKITGINAEAKQVALSIRALLEPEPPQDD
ncbi:MAG: 4-hydroxy-3-methylbut-2-enyl diphosphate reductase, partial [Oscillospiraceae bacterium]|nr:4-hydroxy-3-methylbut-2-enyl diphosphate reductase [Oscillospiraceae bacterium]